MQRVLYAFQKDSWATFVQNIEHFKNVKKIVTLDWNCCLKGEYIICKHEKISLPSYHKITYYMYIGGTYYYQETSETILPDVI